MSRVLCLRGVARGAESCAFTIDDLIEALQPHNTGCVYVEPDSSGHITAAGGGGAARAAAAARLAPSAPARTAELALAPRGSRPAPARTAELALAPRGSRPAPARTAELALAPRGSRPAPARTAELALAPRGSRPAPARTAELALAPRGSRPAPARTAELALAPRGSRPAPALLLRAAAPLPPHHEPLLWFADELLLALGMPFLTPRNVRARRLYVCHECGAGFLEPNPLKLHLFLRCEPFDAGRFWREAGARLRAAPPAPGAAELEALAAEWGRSRDGHACLYCGKLYSRRYGLKIHLRTHTGYRPLRCRYCLRAFGDPSNLNKHVRLHAARAGGAAPGVAAPYACGVCGRALARRRDLERHMRAHGSPPSPE